MRSITPEADKSLCGYHKACALEDADQVSAAAIGILGSPNPETRWAIDLS